MRPFADELTAVVHEGRPIRSAGPAPQLPADPFAALYEISCQLQAEQVHLEKVLRLVVDKTAELLQVDVAWLGLFDEATDTVRIVASCGAVHADFDEMSVRIGDGLGGAALRERSTLVIADYEHYGRNTPAFVHETMRREGIVSVMCSPMLQASTGLGALYAGNRTTTEFRPEHASLLSTLASQASAAIHNARLYQELGLRNALLEQSFAIHRELTAVGLQEQGLSGIAEAVARSIGVPLVLEQDLVKPYRAVHFPPGEHDRAAWDDDAKFPTVVPIRAGEGVIGRVLIPDAPLSELEERALEHGTTLIALELLKQRAARDVEWRLQGEMLEELLEAPDPLPEGLARRAERLRLDPRLPRRVIAIEADDGHVGYTRVLATVRSRTGRLLPLQAGPVLAVKRGNRVILAIPELVRQDEDKLIEALRAAIHELGCAASFGISRAAHDLGRAYREATACVLLAGRARNADAVVRSSDLGPLRFLLDAFDTEQAADMVQEQLGPVLTHDREARTPLLETLRAYLEADGHQTTVAMRCYIHVSTLKYRIGRLQALLGRNLSEPEVRFELRVAFRLLDLLEALGRDVT